MNLITTVMIIIALQFFRYKTRYVNILCDKTLLSAADYTLMVENIPNNLPPSTDYDDEIKIFFEKKVSYNFVLNDVLI